MPFYDKTELIQETLATLESALVLQVLITIIVVSVFVRQFRASILVTGMLPFAILSVFILMKLGNVDANIVSLSGISIAIGTMVDMGIILVENLMERMSVNSEKSLIGLIKETLEEVGGGCLNGSRYHYR